MIFKENVELNKLTTFRLGGLADRLFVPESEEELIELTEERNPKYFIGGGPPSKADYHD